MSSRLSRPALFMGIARLYGERSSCLRAEVGVTATRDWRVVASGYVGAPHGQPHCLDVGCIIEDGGCIRSVHAEANMIAWAARVGISLLDTLVWCTHAPCLSCAKLLINAGVRGVVYEHTYRDGRGLDLLMNQEIPLYKFPGVMPEQ